MSEASATLGPPERLHPISLLSSLAGSVRGMWGMFAAGGYFAIQGHWFLLVAMVVLYTVFSLGAAVLRWTNFSYCVGEREIRIDSGLLNRTHRSLPFDRIQDVTIEQNPLWRALGLARVRFETGGSAGAGEDDGSLAAVTQQRAAEIRDLVRASRGLTPASAVAAGAAVEETPIFAMDPKRVLLAGTFNFSLAVLGGLVGLTQTVGGPLGFDPFKRQFWEGLFAPGTELGDFFLTHQLVAIVAGAITLVLFGFGAGFVRTVPRDYGFRLDRTAVGLRRRRGLFTLTDVVLPAKRTQAAIIATGPVRERFGWAELKLQSLAREESGKGDHVVAPLADAGEIAAVLGSIDWPAPRGQWQHVSRAYVTSFAAVLAPVALIAIGNALFQPIIGIAGLILLAGIMATRILAWRRYAYAVDEDRLLVRSGWWRRRLKILPLKNVQSVDYQQNFIDRWFRAANILIGVAGGGPTTHGIKALPAETARSIRDHLLSRFA
jgi:putative membrane protein